MPTPPPTQPNRLTASSSPYLLQHAHNPVDWWPWGEEAFAEARKRNVPILLSVGYSTCYWCHVMERESFENDSIAALMNDRFVCIKLDREERPDVDDIYMTALVTMTGRGGWPMNVFLEPTTLKPFWCGTYFPPEPRMNIPAWPQVLDRLSAAWQHHRSEVVTQAERVAEAVTEHFSPNAGSQAQGAQRPPAIGQEQVREALTQLLKSFDRTDGGFGPAPKFPQPANLEFLLAVRPLASDDSTRDAIDEAVTRTLNKMACGGVFDQVGGGFHRYSVDANWLVPHFEKMLYDNAQLARVYSLASKLYGDPFYASIATRTCQYILREMTAPDGPFHAAQDAEVDGREGLNYLWTSNELRAVLHEPDSAFIERVYGLDQGLNFQDPHHPNTPSGNVLRLSDRPERLARSMNMPEPGFSQSLDSINHRLYAARRLRKQPRLDDKVLAAWNGLAIGALATTAASLESRVFLDAAWRAAEFLRTRMWNGTTLARSWRDARLGPNGVLEDYACVLAGLLDLISAARSLRSSASQEPVWIHWAEQIADSAHAQFTDNTGRYFDTRAGQPDLFVRTASTTDGAIPSGLSVMLHALLDLFKLTGNSEHLRRGHSLLRGMNQAVSDSPLSAVNTTRALVRVLTDPSLELIARELSSDAEQSPAESDTAFLPVEIYAGVDRITVTSDQPALLRLVVRVADGYHLIAAEPFDNLSGGRADPTPPLTPFRVAIARGTGVKAYADYPKGDLLRTIQSQHTNPPRADAPATPRAYQGTLEFDVALEREGEWTGQPFLVVTYQACTDTECQPVRTVELDVAIDRG